MVAMVKAAQFVEDLAHGVHDFSANAISVFLSNTAPTGSPFSEAVKGALEITIGTDYTGPVALTLTSSGQTSGTYQYVAQDLTAAGAGALVTANTPDVAQFQYVYLFNDTPTSPLDPLIGAWDYGSPVDLGAGESFEVDFGAYVIQIA